MWAKQKCTLVSRTIVTENLNVTMTCSDPTFFPLSLSVQYNSKSPIIGFVHMEKKWLPRKPEFYKLPFTSPERNWLSFSLPFTKILGENSFWLSFGHDHCLALWSGCIIVMEEGGSPWVPHGYNGGGREAIPRRRMLFLEKRRVQARRDHLDH